MAEFLQSVNTNAGALTVLFTGIVTAATVAYAVLTWKLVTETRRLREVQTEPRVEITVKPLDYAVNIVRLCIRNIGLGPAVNVKFSCQVSSGGAVAESLLAEFTDAEWFRTGMAYLGPRDVRFSPYTQMHDNGSAKLEAVLLIRVTYEGALGRKYDDRISVNMSELKGEYQLGKPHLYSIAQSIEKLQKDLHQVLSGFKRSRADVYTSADREAEQQAQRQWAEQQKKSRQGEKGESPDEETRGTTPQSPS